MLNLCTVNTGLFKVFKVIYLNETHELEQKHTCINKTESLVVLQSNGLTGVQTVNSIFCKREHNLLMTQECLSQHYIKIYKVYKDIIIFFFLKKQLVKAS